MTRWQHFLGLAMLALIGSGAAFAADPYPTRPVRVIVGFAAGGPTDVLARVMTQWLSDHLGQRFVVDNRTGAGGNIATEAVIKAPPDGYTILVIVTANVINPSLFPNLPFNFLRDITGVAGLSRISYVVAVGSSLPIRNITELIAYAKTNAGKVTFASGGIGSSSHLSTEIFKGMTGTDLVHVPYKGNAAAYADLIGGRVSMILADRLSAMPHIQSGALRAIAVTSTSRFEAMPDIPTVAETVAGYEASAFYGFGVPRGTPAEIIDKLNTTINAGHRDPKIKARFTELDAVSIVASASEFGAFMTTEAERWARVIKSSGAKAE
ncbi:MAG: Bug family tripartite tricarboxylate transporter substrate binding protein [Burkholderiales bacterium]